MEDAVSNVAMHVARGCLVVPIPVELYDESMRQIQKAVLDRITETGIKGVIIELSGVDIIDSFLCRAIFDTARMTSMLGAATVLTGIKPEVAASLIEFDLEFEDLQTAITIEESFHRLESIVEPKEDRGEDGG
jgi:rsbT antagonist protein RsbS